MNAASVVVLIAVAVAVFFAVRSWRKNGSGGCGSCGGRCADCHKRCDRREKDE